MSNNTLILIDGSSYLYRAFYALPSLSTSTGLPTGAIYGVYTMLNSLLTDYQPQYVAVAFDASGKTFRHTLYTEYKANRQQTPDELVQQIPLLHALIRAMGFPLLVESGVEADDVIGTLTKQAEAAGMNTLIFTGDKDFTQLVNASVTLIDTMKNIRLDRQGVQEKLGVLPEQVIDYLALVGDASDNVPGVHKVGPKTAVKWLNTYGSLEAIMEKAGEIPGKVGEYLRQALDYLPLARQLVTIRCDLPLTVSPKELQLSPPNIAALQGLLAQLEFKISKRVTPPPHQEEMVLMSESPTHTRATQYVTVLTESEFTDWLTRLEQAELFAIDTETTSLDYHVAELVGLSFSIIPGEAAYLPLAHDYLGAPSQLPRDWVLARLKPLLENPNKAKVGQNIKYDRHILLNYDIDLQGIKYDTMLESYVLDSVSTRHDMESLALKYLNTETISYEMVAGKGKNQRSFNQISLEQATPYSAQDADITLQLHRTLWPQVKKSPALARIFEHFEMPLIPVLARMERHGVAIDAALLQAHSVELAQQLDRLEKLAHDMAGETFNLNSPKQLQTILFERLQLPALKKTPKGDASTSEEVLQTLAEDYALPRLILQYRSLSKLKSTYTDALPLQIDPRTRRVHTSYHQAVTATGRLSSSNPNLQNIPVRTPEGRRIRQAFIATPGHRLLSADYSQIELRIMAHLSEDESLLEAFHSGQDIHQKTAAEVFSIPLEAVTADQRRQAKAVNFGLIYGMGAYGLAKQLGIERHRAQHYIDTYFERYPKVKLLMEKSRQQTREQGYVETVLGRRLYIPDIASRQAQRRQYAERSAINAPMQGTAADIIKLAMIRIDHWIRSEHIAAKLLMQVHDELVLEVAETAIESTQAAVAQFMSEVISLKVPLLVDVGVGENWDQAH